MTQEQISEIIAGLNKKTNEGKAAWQKGSAGAQFFLQFKKGAISLTRYRKVANGPISIDLNILNEKGDSIHLMKTSDATSGDEFKMLNDLYEMVKKSYYKIDETLDDIMNSLKSDKSVGDDLPF
jgi:hypothetical protein